MKKVSLKTSNSIILPEITPSTKQHNILFSLFVLLSNPNIFLGDDRMKGKCKFLKSEQGGTWLWNISHKIWLFFLNIEQPLYLSFLNQLDQHDFLFEIYRHQVTHYTGQLAKDTSKHLKDLSSISTGSVDGIASQSEQRQWRLQRERLQDDFTTALNKFQAAQRLAAQKEKEVIKKTRHTGTLNCFCSYFLNV